MYASQQWTKDLLGDTLKEAKDQGLLGGGGETVLYEGQCTPCINSDWISSTNNTIVLSDSIEKYKSIRIEYMGNNFNASNSGCIVTTNTVSVSLIKKIYKSSAIENTANIYGSANYMVRQSFGFYDDTHLALCWEGYRGWTHNDNYIIVTGIK